MSFACRPPGGGGAAGLSGNMLLNHTVLQPGNANGSFQLVSDGTINGTHYTGPATWFSPITTGAGNNYWVKLTKNSGSNNTSGDVLGSVLALSSTRSWTWATTGGVLIANLTLSIYSDAAGTLLVTSCTVDVDVESTP